MRIYIDITPYTNWYTAPYDAGWPGWHPSASRSVGSLPWGISGVSPMLSAYVNDVHANVPDEHKFVGYTIGCDISCEPTVGASAFLLEGGLILDSAPLDSGYAYLSAEDNTGDAISELRVLVQESTWDGFGYQHVGPVAGYEITDVSLEIIAEPITYTDVFVHTLNSGRGKWSRYAFPFEIDDFSQLGGELFIRSGDTVVKVVDGIHTDYVEGQNIGFSGVVQWPWIDAGQPGVTKQMIGFDLVAAGEPSVSFGFDQTDLARFTDPYPIPADTMTGGIIPMPLMAPSVSLRLDFAAGSAWNVRSATIYLNDGKWQP